MMAHLWQPRFKIMLDSFINMVCINMKEIDTVVCKMLQGIIESAFDQSLKAAVEKIVVRAQIC